MKLRRLGTSILTYTLLAFMLFVALFPIYWMLVTSLKPEAEIFRLVPTFWPENADAGGIHEFVDEYRLSGVVTQQCSRSTDGLRDFTGIEHLGRVCVVSLSVSRQTRHGLWRVDGLSAAAGLCSLFRSIF